MHKMGTNCSLQWCYRFSCALIFLASHLAKSQTILPPDQPEYRTPVTERNADAIRNADLDRKKAFLKKIDEENEKEKVAKELSKKDESLLQETVKEKPFKFILGINFLYPGIWVEDHRETYKVDLSAQIDARFRLFSGSSQDAWQPWLGFRFASFTGSGVQDGRAGRYSLSYFGPSISLGSFDLAPRSLGSQVGAHAVDPLSSRTGLLWSAGLAAVSKYGEADTVSGGDLGRKPIAFDAPGLWMDVNRYAIFYNSFAFKYGAGFQLAAGKRFYFISFGFAGFH